MADLVKEAGSRWAPWRKGIGWPVLAVEAVILLAVGVFVLVSKDTAANLILQLIGAILLLVSLYLAASNVRQTPDGTTYFTALRAGIGMTAGAIAAVSWWSDSISDLAVSSILGWSLIAISLLQIAGALVVGGRAALKLGMLVGAVITVVLGVVLVTSGGNSTESRLNLLGGTIVAFGLVLAAYAALVYVRSRPAQASPGPIR